MADGPTTPRELYSIVVVGQMNPAIHHPAWYRSVNLLNDSERDAALAAPGLLSSSQLSQFVAPDFTVNCAPNRWEIQAFRHDSLERILATAAAVFEALSHTPVNAFGFNFNVNKEVNVDGVGTTLGDALARLPIGIDRIDGIKGEISLQWQGKDHKNTLVVGQSPLGNNFVLIRFNTHHDIVGEKGYFDLTPMLRAEFGPAYKQAQGFIDSIAIGLEKMRGSHATRS